MKKPLALLMAALLASAAFPRVSRADDPPGGTYEGLKKVDQGGDSDGWRYDSNKKMFVKEGYAPVYVGDAPVDKKKTAESQKLAEVKAAKAGLKTNEPPTGDPNAGNPNVKHGDPEPSTMSKILHHPATWMAGGALVLGVIGGIVAGPGGFLLGAMLGIIGGGLLHSFFGGGKK